MSELRKMTRMGGDLRKIARLLQDKGRNGDTILAHINPREAALLREQGGAGTINPETGLMEFQDSLSDLGGYEQVPEGLFEGAAYIPERTGYESVPEGLFEGAAYTPETSDQVFAATRSLAGAPRAETPFFDQAYGAGALPQLDRGPIPDASRLSAVQPFDVTQERIAAEPLRTGAGARAEKGFLESLQGGDKTRLALGALGGLQTALTARKARQGAQQAAQQIRDIGAPYQQRGLAEQAAAARGELTPVNQQALEAQRARAAQAGVSRGGVGIAQQQRAEEDLRQRLLAAQQDFGLKLSGIGDQYTSRAIQEGIRADAEISNLFSNYYGNLTRLATPTLIQATQPARG
jgi:hypothetical protein